MRTRLTVRRLVLVAIFGGLGYGCTDASSPQVGADRSMAVITPGTTVGTFVLLANGSVSINDRSGLSPQISGGDVGAAGVGVNASQPTVLIGSAAVVDLSRVVIGQRVVLHDRASVGAVKATQIAAPVATYTSLSAFFAPPALPVVRPVTSGSTGITVSAGQTLPLAAGRSGAVLVRGTLELSGGIYEMASLTLDNDGKILVRASSVVRVAQGFKASDRAKLLLATNLKAADLRIVVAGVNSGTTSSVIFGNDATVSALFLSTGGFVAGDRLIATGAIAARDIDIGHDARVTFQSGFPCNADATCADTSTCTSDSCNDGYCSNVPAPNGTVCNDNNACTQVDKCQAAVCVGTSPKTCTASDVCHTVGTCDTTSGLCSNPPAPNGTSCSDGNSCTQADGCQAGICSGAALTCSTPQTCAALGGCALVPVFDCVVDNGDGTFVAFFGFRNDSNATLSLPVGPSNHFSPGLADRHQPTGFASGGRDYWVVAHFDGSPLSWTLGGTTVTASSTSVSCPPFPAGGEGDEESNGNLVEKFHPLATGQAPDPSTIPKVASDNLFPLVSMPVVPYPQAPAAQGQSGVVAESLIKEEDRSARSTEVVIVNRTTQTLTFVEGQFEGEAEAQPQSGISPQGYGDLESGSNGFLQGTGGHITYAFGGATIKLSWDNPFIGDNTYDSTLSGAGASGFTVDRVGGEGNRATVFFILRSTSTPATNCPFGTHQWMVDSLRSPEGALSGFDKAVGFLSTPAKILLGVGKWASTGCIATRVVGRVVQQAHSTDDFYTIDVALEEFDGAFLTDSGKAVRIEVPPLLGEVSLPGLFEIEVPNALAINPANIDIKVNGLPGVGSRIIFSGDVFIDHGSFLEVHPSTPIQKAPACDQIPPGDPVPLFCNTTLNDFFIWDTGQAPTPMGRGDHRACFLTGMRGAFQDASDEVHATLDPATNNWFLTGAGPGPVHAQARCIASDSIGSERTWSQGDPDLSLDFAANGRACFLTRVAGHFEGAGERVTINDLAQGFGSIKLTGSSGEAGVSASARCLDHLSRTDFTFQWSQGTTSFPLELVSVYPACFLQGVAGRFEGGGEEVNISAGLFPAGLRWVLGGSSQQSGVEVFASCIAP